METVSDKEEIMGALEDMKGNAKKEMKKAADKQKVKAEEQAKKSDDYYN